MWARDRATVVRWPREPQDKDGVRRVVRIRSRERMWLWVVSCILVWA